MSDEIWSGLIGAISGAITAWLVSLRQARQVKVAALLARFDDSLDAAILGATILWSRDSGDVDVEKATELRATFLKLSGSVEDLVEWSPGLNRRWAADVGRAHMRLRLESTGDAFATHHRKAEPDRCERIREAGQALRAAIRGRVR